MDQKTRESLFHRSREGLASGRPELGEGTDPSPVGRYLDPVRFMQERDLFRAHPQPVCTVSQLARPGDWLALAVLDVPVLLSRGADGELRAFLNVCRHRGAELVPAGCGEGRERFTCPYHAWTYSSDGRLTGVPKDWGFPDLQASAHGLRALAVGEHAGMIWVIPDVNHASARVDLLLGPLVQDLEAMGMARHVAFAPRTFPLKANWKLVIDGTLEAYHFKIAHRQTIAPLFADNLQVIDEMGLNRRLYLVREIMRARMADAPTMEVVRACGSILYHFFPGTLVLVHSDHAQFLRIWPVAADACEIHDFTMIPEVPGDARAQAHWERNSTLFRATLDEDYALMASIQRGLASGANDSLLFGRFEQAAARFEAQVENVLHARPSGAGSRTP